MKIFTAPQIRQIDQFTIEHEPIKSIDLMERASGAVVQAIAQRWAPTVGVVVMAGPGNNGGDALTVARLLAEQGYQVQTFLFNISGQLSADCAESRKRLLEKHAKEFVEVTSEFDPPRLEQGMLVVDGLFGSGLNKPLAGGFASLVKYINASAADVVSIDMPSGLMTEDNTCNVRAHIIRATLTLTFQQPKLAFLFAENQQYIGRLQVLDIRLSREAIRQTVATYNVTERTDIVPLLHRRDPFAHKGSMGHALLIAGSYGMAGASLLAARAALRSGVGKITVHCPRRNIPILQTALPEAIVQPDREEALFSEAVSTDDYQAVAIGPGLGTADATALAMITQLRRTQCPLVVDADAINMLAGRRAWIGQLPKGVILTPHAKELDRLEGASVDSYERLTKARALARRVQGYVILKGRYTAVCMPDGTVMFNATGNAGMATAGTGDVLTGILAALLARGYSQHDACLVGVWLHGLAGDLAARRLGQESLMAGDVIDYLPQALLSLMSNE